MEKDREIAVNWVEIGFFILTLLLAIASFILNTHIYNSNAVARAEAELHCREVDFELLAEDYMYLELEYERLYNENAELKSTYMDECLSLIEPLNELDKEEYLNKYKEIMGKFGTNLPTENSYNFSDEQINMILRCIETEVYQCPFEAKLSVASVILNRVESEEYSSDPIKIITSPFQFAYGRTNISEDTKSALEYVMLFGDTTNGCMAFRSDTNPDTWYGWKYQYSDGSHYLYK